MNGYGSQRSVTATALSAIQTITTTVWPTMYCGVPNTRAIRSAMRPKESCPNAPCRCACARWCRSGSTVTPTRTRRTPLYLPNRPPGICDVRQAELGALLLAQRPHRAQQRRPLPGGEPDRAAARGLEVDEEVGREPVHVRHEELLDAAEPPVGQRRLVPLVLGGEPVDVSRELDEPRDPRHAV